MSLKQYLLSGVAAAMCLIQTGCEIGGQPVDLRYPSVAELDSADVGWGLPSRKDKGAPKRSYQYPIEDSGSAPAASAPVAAAPANVAEPQAPANPIPAAADPQIDVNKLR